jgi:hypothetical protein
MVANLHKTQFGHTGEKKPKRKHCDLHKHFANIIEQKRTEASATDRDFARKARKHPNFATGMLRLRSGPDLNSCRKKIKWLSQHSLLP